MRVRVNETVYEGPAVDLSGLADGETVATAVDEGAATPPDGPTVGVACLQPAPVHERAGFVRPDMGLRTRTALAAAARSRGLTAPQDERVERLDARLAAFEPVDAPDLATARERVANVGSDVERLRERVATLRGRLAAARDADRDTASLRADLGEATRSLTEVETERIAARETLERAREQVRDARDDRERHRRLEDERANLARGARRHLVDALREEFAAAVDAAPESPPASDAADPFDVDAVTAALAVCRVAHLRAPVVLACDRFPTAGTAAAWLDAPVIRT